VAKGRTKKKAEKACWEWRALRWLVLTAFWRLPRAILRFVAWLLGLVFAAIAGLFGRAPAQVETADGFYRSYKWRRLRVDALEANRQRYGMLACECCGMVDVESFHVDHIHPRSTHPELALDPANLQVLCDACNIGKGAAYATNWRGGEDPRPPRRRGWRRLFART
jgi:hypothetical protein